VVDNRSRYVSPSYDELAFNCPHCGALAKQHWCFVYLFDLPKNLTPQASSEATAEKLHISKAKGEDNGSLEHWLERLAKERHHEAGGRDRIDHPRGTHDDVANAAAGALVFAYEELNIRLGSGSRTL
jgi:hypothetical protein